MDQFEEFNHFYIQQSKEEENPMISEEQNEEDINKKDENEIIIDEEPQKTLQKSKLSRISSKRYNLTPKKYQTYKMDYKKKVIDEVNIYNIIINI